MEPKFTGPSFTIGIEEELMILDSESLALANAIEAILEEFGEGESVKPELLEPVLEINTAPHPNTREAGEELRSLRRAVIAAAERRGLCIGSAGTHPFALWEDQRVSSGPRYRELIAALRFVARQEIIFGLHVHVGIDDSELQILVMNAVRAFLPPLLALSVNSPFWCGRRTGVKSVRSTIFKRFPRTQVPDYYHSWDDYQKFVALLVRTNCIDDGRKIWWDVRPHAYFKTLEFRDRKSVV